MLKSYEIKNFKSFKNKTYFDLTKTNYQILNDTNVFNNILKGIMFVGANAAGKSNSIAPIRFLLDDLFSKNEFVFESYVCFFSKEPELELKYSFVISDSLIEYYISYQMYDKIISENLCLNNQQVLERKGSFAKLNIGEETMHNEIANDVLFLREVYFNTKFRGNDVLKEWFDYLKNSVYLDIYNKNIISYCGEDLSLKKFVEEEGATKFNNFFDEFNFEQHIEYDKLSKGNILTIESPEKMIYFKRKGIEEPIPYGFESLGNRNLLYFLPAFFHCIENNCMLLLDEFSSGFHNDLEELLIRYFMINANKSQLIFVSHSTNLLKNSLLRPDQLYSVSFNKEGSTIKRFSSEQPRIGQNLEKMYLGGVFSGLPRYENKFK